MLAGKRVLLVVAGGVAAYKSLELVRLLRGAGAAVRCVLTAGGERFVAPLALAAISEDKVYRDLFSLTDESEMGHIRLSREADILVAAPATADLIARMAGGRADDLASAVLLAADKPVLVAPAMNARMWAHPATRRNAAALAADGVRRVGPEAGDLACGETGPGRMAEPAAILAAIDRLLGAAPLAGVRALVTSGPTHEPLDPVRYIANRSSGKQGHAIARALGDLGAEVALVSGPTAEPDPPRARAVRVETAEAMLAACRAALPVDVAVCAAAVADWRARAPANRKAKRGAAGSRTVELVANPDILAALCAAGGDRPRLVIGFAAETEDVVANARAKRAAKGCDWIVANDVSESAGVFGGDRNSVHVIDDGGVESWPPAAKAEVARRLAARIAAALDARAAA